MPGERRVEIEYALKDNVSPGLEKIAERTKRSAAAFEALQQRLSQGIAGGASPDVLLNATKALGRADQAQAARAAQDYLDPDRAIRGGGPAAFDPTALARQKILQQRQRELVQGEMARLNPPTVPEPFDPRAEAAKLFGRRLQREVVQDELQRLTGTPGVDDLARQRVERRRQQAAVAARARELQGLTPEDERGGYQNPLAGTGFARVAAPLFLLHSVGQGLEGLAKGAEQAATQARSTGEAAEMMAKHLLEGVPIIGGFARAAGTLTDVLSGATRQRFEAARDVQGFGQIFGLARTSSQLAFAGQERTNVIANQLTDAWTQRRGAEYYSAGLTPAALASFRSDQFGEQRQKIAEAEAAARAARDTVAFRRTPVDEARRNAERLQAEADRIHTRQAEITEAQAGLPPPEAGEGKGRLSRAWFETEYRAERAKLGEEGLKADADVVMARKAAEERLTELQKARTDAAGKENELARSRLELDRARLGVMREGAQAAGVSQPGELETLLQAVKQAKQFGVKSLIPEQAQALLANPTTRDFAAVGFREAGANDPRQRQLEEAVGLRQPGENRDVAQMADDLAKKAAEINLEYRTETEKILREALRDLGRAIIESVRAQIQLAADEVRQKVAREAAVGQPQH